VENVDVPRGTKRWKRLINWHLFHVEHGFRRLQEKCLPGPARGKRPQRLKLNSLQSYLRTA